MYSLKTRSSWRSVWQLTFGIGLALTQIEGRNQSRSLRRQSPAGVGPRDQLDANR